ncbi:hypothetical protein HDV04_002877 [Boothiomyces sp. JEL0838]|nr:hypothetical protein HDV04_002877 [Boothiomyces sp. JEL0838]
MTLNYDCTLGRKLAYSLTYVGYLTYNFYQIKQIIRKIKAKRTERIAFISLFMGRIGSLAYNLYYISGTVVAPAASGPYSGAGPCMTNATVNMVLQEHIYNVFMGLMMIGKVFYIAILTDTSKLWKYFFKVMDFEIITFLIYLTCEIIFVGFYLAFPPTDISYFNVFYDQVIDTNAGFLSYDFYQIKEVFRKTKAGKTERIVFYFLFLLRVASLAYNLYYMQGIIADPLTSGPFIGAGPCKTLATDTMVHQEHLYIIFLEFVIIARVIRYALSLDKNKSWKRFYRVIDFEILTFVTYFVCEVAYIALYFIFPPTNISVFLFALNAAHFSSGKVEKAVELEAMAEEKGHQKSSISSMFFRKSSPKKKKSVKGRSSPATLNPSLCILLLLYGIFVGSDFVIFVYSVGIRRILPKEFLAYGLIATFSIFSGIVASTYFLMMISYDCVLGSKIAYSCYYFGYMVYNLYQIKEVVRRTSCSKYEAGGLYLLLAGRLSSLIYNLIYISGTIADPVTTGNYIGAGPCKALMTDAMENQEHIYIIIMEIIMLSKIFHYAYSVDHEKDFRRFSIIVDFEIFTFVGYLLCEIIYMVFFVTFPATDFSYIKVLYTQVSIFMFMVNATNFSKNKALKSTDSTRNEQKSSKGSGISSVLKMKTKHPFSTSKRQSVNKDS